MKYGGIFAVNWIGNIFRQSKRGGACPSYTPVSLGACPSYTPLAEGHAPLTPREIT